MANIKMGNVKGELFVRIMVGNKPAVVNSSTDTLNLKAGTVIMGCGKVTWKRLGKDDDVPNGNLVQVVFSSSSDMVVVGPTYMSLHKAINDRRSLNPTASVCYHSLKDEPGQGGPTGSFSLTATSRVFAVLESAGGGAEGEGEAGRKKKGEGMKQETLASGLPMDLWDENPVAGMRFTMRWASAGLMPVRPQVLLLEDVDLPGGMRAQIVERVSWAT